MKSGLSPVDYHLDVVEAPIRGERKLRIVRNVGDVCQKVDFDQEVCNEMEGPMSTPLMRCGYSTLGLILVLR
ncbi:hypothetical protein L9F63_003404, partial [Diploptera punctata]